MLLHSSNKDWKDNIMHVENPKRLETIVNHLKDKNLTEKCQ